MTNDLLLNKLNALLDEKEAEAASQGLNQNFVSEEESISDILAEKFNSESGAYDENKSYQEENAKESLFPEAKDIAKENESSIFDGSADEIVATDDLPKTSNNSPNSLKLNIALTLLSFIMGGIFFQIFLSEHKKEKNDCFRQ